MSSLESRSAENPVLDEVVPPGRPWSGIVRRGEILRIVDLDGEQGVDFLCYNAGRPEERYHAPNTLKAAGTLRLTTGHVLYSDEARALFTIIEDTCGYHDTIGGCCSAPSNAMLYGVTDCPGCRENFLAELDKYGLGRKDIVPNINFFCNVPVDAERRLAPTVFVDASQAGIQRQHASANESRKDQHDWTTYLIVEELQGLLVNFSPLGLVNGLLAPENQLVVLLVFPLGSDGG